MGGPIITILLVLAAVKSVVFGVILYLVFRKDIKEWWVNRRNPPPVRDPVCMYCQSTWTHAVDEGQTRWEGDELVLVTTYECEHCRLPFWHVERVPVSAAGR